MPVEIRRARLEDLPAIVGLLQQLSLDDPREDASQRAAYEAAFTAIEADPRQRLIVATDDARIVGTVAVIVVPNLSHTGRPYAIVENVVVEPAGRGRGVGEALMRRAIDIAREAGCYKLALTSNKRRKDAHRFYERLGFSATHEGFRIDF